MTVRNWLTAPTTAVVSAPVMHCGYHCHPRKGACLMEFAGALPGGAWTDHPAGVQPMLGFLARAVNDATTDSARMALLPWAAWLVGTASADDDETLAVSLATGAGAAALRHADRSAAQRLAPAMAHLSWEDPATPEGLRRWWQAARRRHAAARVIRSSVSAVAATSRHADDTLRVMLADAVNTVRERDGLPTVDVNVTGYDRWPATQPIRVEVRIPDGSESRYDYCTALPDHGPPALTDAWTARRPELRRPRAGRGTGQSPASRP